MSDDYQPVRIDQVFKRLRIHKFAGKWHVTPDVGFPFALTFFFAHWSFDTWHEAARMAFSWREWRHKPVTSLFPQT